MTGMKKVRGLQALVEDAVEHGSRAVERVHRETARRPFVILEQIPAIAAPARAVHVVHDAAVATAYAVVRRLNRALGATVGAALDVVDEAGRERVGPRPDR